MKDLWIYKNDSDTLIIFCNGWGMDEHPFKPLPSGNCDVFMLYDYSDFSLNISLADLMAGYEEVVLIAWSMGVWAAQKIFKGRKGRLQKAIAVNGTLRPIDERFGIAEQTVKATRDQLRAGGLEKFYRRMCLDKALHKKFLQNRPNRSLASQSDELTAILMNDFSHDDGKSIYDTVIVASRDHIIVTRNQLDFWAAEQTVKITGSHFPFYSYSSWGDMLNCFDSPGDIIL